MPPWTGAGLTQPDRLDTNQFVALPVICRNRQNCNTASLSKIYLNYLFEFIYLHLDENKQAAPGQSLIGREVDNLKMFKGKRVTVILIVGHLDSEKGNEYSGSLREIDEVFSNKLYGFNPRKKPQVEEIARTVNLV